VLSLASWRAIDTVRAEDPYRVVVTGDVADKRSSIPTVTTWARQLCEAAGESAIVLEHCPDDATSIVASGHASLVLTGHTHGGQVRLPLWGDRLIATLEGSLFVRGLYPIDGVPLYVSQGLGMSVLPLRFFCPPEVTVFTLRTYWKIAF